ncbi:rhodanese-like domain-containing protein [Desulfitobacterium metallireducens]|uniref:rhodanese-like domain-containing protein n=1 Tax=Desulfitobacterium metallireducens TaxID=142877 RepID=UPI00023142CF|nr:rhodanese-like domain-containing protein [Desulfitobacterium metallireducens]
MKAKSKSMRSKSLMFSFLLLLGFGMIFLSGCSNSQSTAGQDPPKANSSQEQANVNQTATTMIPDTAKVSTDELDAAMQANKGWQLIDVRESREFAAGHIKLAINRPLADLKNNLNQISKDKEIVLIDLNGSRSESAWQILVDSGYDKNKVKVLTGGMLYWNGIISSAGSNSVNNSSSGSAATAPKPEVQGVVGGC